MMNNIPIIGKLLTLIALFGVFVIGVAAYATGQMHAIQTGYADLIDHEEAAALDNIRANRSLVTARAAIGDLLIAITDEGNKRALAELQDSHAAFASYMNAARKISPANDQDLAGLEAQGLAILDQNCADAIRAGQVATTPADVMASLTPYLRTCSSKFPPMMAAMIAETNLIVGQAHKGAEAQATAANTAIKLTLGGIVGGLVITIAGIMWAIRSWITRPLGNLSDTMARLAAGDLTTTIVGEERRDEVGVMAKTVQVFKAAGLEKVRLEQATAEQRRIAEEERARFDAERAQVAADDALTVTALGTGLSALADGNLTHRITEAFAPKTAALKTDFNAAMDKLQETMTTISTNTQGIRGGGEEISQAADDLSRRTEQQAASLEETAAALDQITATVRRTAEGAKEASTVVGAAKSDAEHSGQVVQQAVAAMSAIESSSNQVSQIIGVIDEIAFQTNLLALNAGVEAARAGDAGRGFAVVASEVRALAQRSASAAKEIKTLIAASTQQVNAGVGLVGETGKSLERIVKQVAQINTLVTEIAASAQEQATGLNQVNTAVNQMDQVTQQNAAMVEQSTAATHALAREAEELARLVAQFKTGAQTVQAGRQAPARRQAAPAAQRTHTVLKMVGQGGAALKPQSQPSAESWEEF